MKILRHTRKLITSVMLLVFTISITPKKYFHDLFSCHIDFAFKNTGGKEKQLAAYKFNCGFVEIVATAPFIKSRALVIKEVKVFQSLNVRQICYPVYDTVFNCFEHRGPPVAIWG